MHAGRGRPTRTFRAAVGRIHPRQRSVRSADERQDRRQHLRPNHLRTERHHAARSREPRHLPPAGQPAGGRVVDDDPRRRRRHPRGTRARSSRCRKATDEGDITDDDYRFTAELRGRNYGAPGSVTYRIIAGDGVSRDGARVQLNFDSIALVLLEVHLADRLRQSPGAPGRSERQRHLQLVDRHGQPSVPPGAALHLPGRPDRPRWRLRCDACPGSPSRTSGRRPGPARRFRASK